MDRDELLHKPSIAAGIKSKNEIASINPALTPCSVPSVRSSGRDGNTTSSAPINVPDDPRSVNNNERKTTEKSYIASINAQTPQNISSNARHVLARPPLSFYPVNSSTSHSLSHTHSLSHYFLPVAVLPAITITITITFSFLIILNLIALIQNDQQALP